MRDHDYFKAHRGNSSFYHQGTLQNPHLSEPKDTLSLFESFALLSEDCVCVVGVGGKFPGSQIKAKIMEFMGEESEEP